MFSTRCVATVVALLMPAAALAGTTVVEVLGNNTFDPRDITIQMGDTVRWEWVGGSHTVTSGTGANAPGAGNLFDEPIDRDNPEFSFTFTQFGQFPYFCRPHEFFDMRGTVTVAPAGTRSLVALVQLENGNPIDCATVVVTGGPFQQTAVVDNQGVAEFGGLSNEVSSFIVEVSAPEFALATGPVTVNDADFDVNGMHGVTLIVAPTDLTLQEVVRGRVTDMRNGAALANVRVEAMLDDAPVDPPAVGYSCADGAYEVPRVPAKGTTATLEFRLANYEPLVVNQPPIGESLNVALMPTADFEGFSGCSAMMIHHHWMGRPPWADWALIGLALTLALLVGNLLRKRRQRPHIRPSTPLIE